MDSYGDEDEEDNLDMAYDFQPLQQQAETVPHTNLSS